ncbi:hypothetical protein Ahy_A09g042666 [Arachis hypogaea]|uniref:At1g61320/AtMIF1 LRR domain-containing protein n=1 Tax=Arachis hypogaea TaxID=3818 RepID=A0A445BGI1_ARAHY|nr:hypothetical protein Ahy_A09g042666 [Arachis hypogaea]
MARLNFRDAFTRTRICTRNCRVWNFTRAVWRLEISPSLWHLKDVTLAWIPLKLESIRTLLSTCEWMESLSLKNCWDIESFDIKKLELKKLVIDRCIIGTDYIGFEAPNLKVFKYCGSEPPGSEVKVVAGTIEEADLDLSPMDEFFACGNELRKFIRDFFAVNVLTVCSVILQGDEPVRLAEGLRVRHLKMKIQMHPQEFCGFFWFHNSCPRPKLQ